MENNLTYAGYKYLLTYQYSSVICDLTIEFCNLYYSGREFLRQRDQMTQAARSGKQNICEGYSVESLESYIKLLGVARGSLKELLEDFEDYLRQHSLTIWDKNSPRMRDMRVPSYPTLSRAGCQPDDYALPKNNLSTGKANRSAQAKVCQ